MCKNKIIRMEVFSVVNESKIKNLGNDLFNVEEKVLKLELLLSFNFEREL